MTRKPLALTMAVALVGTLAACGSSNSESNSGGGDSSSSSGASGSGSGKTINIGYIDWDEDVAVTYLWKNVLESKGYTVNLKHVSDAGPLYVGLNMGQIDLYLDSWLPQTHKVYWDKYGKNLTDVSTWYDNAKLTIAVPKYMNIDSIDQLNSVKSKVSGKIVGIEPGAGLTAATKKAISSYGLDYTLQTSSTAAMLASLKKATDAKQPVVVTLWRPHWAYASYPIKDLKDPKGVMGKAEKIHTVGSKDFSSKFPQLETMLKKFKMDDTKLANLENVVLQKNKNNPEQGVKQWLKANPDFVKSLG